MAFKNKKTVKAYQPKSTEVKTSEIVPVNQKLPGAGLIFIRDKKQVVSARELHARLEIKAYFAHWMKRMAERGFVENKDFILLAKNDKQDSGWGGSNKTDYALTIEMATTICIIQTGKRGIEVRKIIADHKTAVSEANKMYSFYDYRTKFAPGKYPPLGQTGQKYTMARDLCTHYGVAWGRTHHPKYGDIDIFPRFVLDEVFTQF